MVIVDLTGGLGNQMFEYATGRAVAYASGQELLLNTLGYAQDHLRDYALHHLNIKAAIATAEEISSVKPYYEDQFNYVEHIFNIRHGVLIKGYRQSEKYFLGIAEIIRSDFQVIDPLTGLNRCLAEQISLVNAVSLHIRRGDYVHDQFTNEFHGVCTLEYYHKAISMITHKLQDPYFFVFSDDPEWAMNNLKVDEPCTFITNNDADHHYEDLRLMSLCKHHIIANSSFSWWGAWLSTYRDKVVITPLKWFGKCDFNTADLIPPQWLRI